MFSVPSCADLALLLELRGESLAQFGRPRAGVEPRRLVAGTFVERVDSQPHATAKPKLILFVIVAVAHPDRDGVVIEIHAMRK
jgi:hypothetical protein